MKKAKKRRKNKIRKRSRAKKVRVGEGLSKKEW